MRKVLFLLLVLISFNVYADSCSKEELARLKNIANQVEFEKDYEIKEENGELNAVFSIIAHNLNKDIKVNYENNYLLGDYKEFKNDGTNNGKLSVFSSGQKVNVTIRAYTSDGCAGKVLLQKIVSLPYINNNYYLFTGMCESYPDFKYCSPVLDEKISVDKFMNEYNLYTNKSENNEHIVDLPKENTDNTIILIGGIVLLVIIVIFVFIFNRKRKNDI